jgi:hypothetical protein
LVRDIPAGKIDNLFYSVHRSATGKKHEITSTELNVGFIQQSFASFSQNTCKKRRKDVRRGRKRRKKGNKRKKKEITGGESK